jgi:cytochrome b6-f complex iron-sulfur subunit
VVALRALYPSQTTGFGGPITVGRKSDFPAALPQTCALDIAGVFYRAEARAFLVHLSAETEFLLDGSALDGALLGEHILRDGDGTYWIALYQACPHLGAMLAYQLGCRSFKCPSHGAHFHCDGEYLDGPSPRSMDRFPVSFASDNVVVDTGRLDRSVDRPQAETRLLPPPPNACIVG